MKKAVIMITAILMSAMAWGQAQINTKKVKLSDFTQKITKVVLSGNDFMDSALKDEVTLRWRISPYEFCTLEEFNSLKTNDDYYFLLTTNGQFKKESGPTIQFLTIVKGGKGAENGIGDMLEVVSMPIASAQFPSGREIAFLPAFLDIMQDYTLDSMEKDSNAYGGLGTYAPSVIRSEQFDIVFAKSDLAVSPDNLGKDINSGKGIVVEDDEDVDMLLQENAENTLVSYVVAPFEPQPGSFCYKMLIDTQTHELYYFKRHRITKKDGAGFLANDLRRIYSVR